MARFEITLALKSNTPLELDLGFLTLNQLGNGKLHLFDNNIQKYVDNDETVKEIEETEINKCEE